MKISGRIFEKDKLLQMPEGHVRIALFLFYGSRMYSWTGMNNATGTYEFDLYGDLEGQYTLFAISTNFRIFRRGILLEPGNDDMTLDIQLEPLHPPESITVGQPPEPTPSRLVRCLTCGATAPLEWLKSRHQQEIYLPEWPHVSLLQGRKSTIGWMHAHHTLPFTFHPTEIIPRPKDFKKEAAEEMYEALEAMTDGSTAMWTEKLRNARAALQKARGESPDA